MPNIKSAKKRVKIAAVRTMRNKNYNSALKTAVKKANLAIDQNADNKNDTVREKDRSSSGKGDSS